MKTYKFTWTGLFQVPSETEMKLRNKREAQLFAWGIWLGGAANIKFEEIK